LQSQGAALAFCPSDESITVVCKSNTNDFIENTAYGKEEG